jgi:hypothetical protein
VEEWEEQRDKGGVPTGLNSIAKPQGFAMYPFYQRCLLKLSLLLLGGPQKHFGNSGRFGPLPTVSVFLNPVLFLTPESRVGPGRRLEPQDAGLTGNVSTFVWNILERACLLERPERGRHFVLSRWRPAAPWRELGGSADQGLDRHPVGVFYYCRTYYKAVRVGGGGEWRTCAMRDDEPRPVWMSLPITH